jgi:hypothetical protein
MKTVFSILVFLLPLVSVAELDRGVCVGMPVSCEFVGEGSCLFQVGCNFDRLNHSCTGLPWNCSLFASSMSCFSQKGCRWQARARVQ